MIEFFQFMGVSLCMLLSATALFATVYYALSFFDYIGNTTRRFMSIYDDTRRIKLTIGALRDDVSDLKISNRNLSTDLNKYTNKVAELLDQEGD